MRSRLGFRIVREALIACKAKIRFRIVEYSVQRNHVHIIAEADDTYAVSRAMRGLSIRIARRVNVLMGEKGSRIRDRYMMKVLRTPMQTLLALRYVLNNRRRHAAQSGKTFGPDWIDPCSSAIWFGGWSRPVRARDPCPDLESGVVAPRSRSLVRDWQLYGALDPAVVPGPLSSRAVAPRRRQGPR